MNGWTDGWMDGQGGRTSHAVQLPSYHPLLMAVTKTLSRVGLWDFLGISSSSRVFLPENFPRSTCCIKMYLSCRKTQVFILHRALILLAEWQLEQMNPPQKRLTNTGFKTDHLPILGYFS